MTPADHGKLNKPSNAFPGGEKASKDFIEEKRIEYADDNVAQQQIDVYAGDTEYTPKIRKLVEAIRGGDKEEEEKLSAWFKKNYPDV